MLDWTTRLPYLALGWLCLGLAVVGVVLPLLPTTPFLLVAAFFFARGSERTHRWLIEHPRFGPPIRDWNEHRAVSLKAKWLGTSSLLAVVAVSLWLEVEVWIVALQVATLTTVGIFLWTRPRPPGPGH